MFQSDICKSPVNDSIAYAHPLLSKTSNSESKISRDSNSKYNAVSNFSQSTLMSSPITCSSSSSGKGQKIKCRPKRRRASQFSEDRENINPATVCDSVTSANVSMGFDKSGTVCQLPVSKKHCSKKTDLPVRSGVDDLLAAECDKDEMQPADKYTSLNSKMAASSQRYGIRKALSDVTIKSALNRSDDRLHELIGDFSRPYSLPVTENNKHRDLKTISCHTVSSDY